MINNNYLAMLTRQTDEYSSMGFVYRALADFDNRLRYVEEAESINERLLSVEEKLSRVMDWIEIYGKDQ